jgi:hypothetical protein
VAVAFERFRTLTLRGRPQNHFRVGQPFLLDMVWTVRNLSGTTFADRTFTYQLWTGAQWRTIQAIPDRILISNGTIPYQKQAEFFEAGTYRIVVRIRIGSASANKGVVVHVAQ